MPPKKSRLVIKPAAVQLEAMRASLQDVAQHFPRVEDPIAALRAAHPVWAFLCHLQAKDGIHPHEILTPVGQFKDQVIATQDHAGLKAAAQALATVTGKDNRTLADAISDAARRSDDAVKALGLGMPRRPKVPGPDHWSTWVGDRDAVAAARLKASPGAARLMLAIYDLIAAKRPTKTVNRFKSQNSLRASPVTARLNKSAATDAAAVITLTCVGIFGGPVTWQDINSKVQDRALPRRTRRSRGVSASRKKTTVR